MGAPIRRARTIHTQRVIREEELAQHQQEEQLRQWVCLQKVLERKTFVGDPECMATIATLNKFNADMDTLTQNLRTL